MGWWFDTRHDGLQTRTETCDNHALRKRGGCHRTTLREYLDSGHRGIPEVNGIYRMRDRLWHTQGSYHPQFTMVCGLRLWYNNHDGTNGMAPWWSIRLHRVPQHAACHSAISVFDDCIRSCTCRIHMVMAMQLDWGLWPRSKAMFLVTLVAWFARCFAHLLRQQLSYYHQSRGISGLWSICNILTQWSAVAFWSWDIQVETCAICKNHIMEPCIDCQANASGTQADCNVAWGKCNHAFHFHCINRWLKSRNTCPLDSKDWEFTRYGQ